MAGIDRYARILNLFTVRRSTWTVMEISEELGTAASTIYRSVRELVNAGFLESTVDANFRLGSAILQFERIISATDPLIRAGSVFLETLVVQVDVPCSVVLARLHGEKVMCVAEARSDNFTTKTSYERGRPMPILKGATSRAILAGMDSRKRKKLLKKLSGYAAFDDEKLARDLEFIRKHRFCLSRGEIDKGLVGMASPVRNKSIGIDASLSIILEDKNLDDALQARLLSILATNSKLIENYMEDAYQDIYQRTRHINL